MTDLVFNKSIDIMNIPQAALSQYINVYLVFHKISESCNREILREKK